MTGDERLHSREALNDHPVATFELDARSIGAFPTREYIDAVYDRADAFLKQRSIGGYGFGAPEREGVFIFDEQGFWVVCAFERAIRSQIAVFPAFDDAIDHFIWRLTQSPGLDRRSLPSIGGDRSLYLSLRFGEPPPSTGGYRR